MGFFNIIPPTPLLATFVKYYWTLKDQGISCPVSERIIPSGLPQIIFHRGNKMFSVTENRYQPRSMICGQSSGFIDLSSDGNIDMIVISFFPIGLKAFFQIPINEFSGLDVSFDELNDRSLLELADRVYNTQNNTEAISLIESFLILRLNNFDSYNHRRMNSVIRAIDQSHQSNIKLLSEIACLSYKQFYRIFSEYTGTPPKEFTRIVRFQRALSILERNPTISFTQLALDCGYYDQPHLIKEFKAFSGYTPIEYMALCKPHSDYFSDF